MLHNPSPIFASYSHYDTPTLIQIYADGPERLELAIGGLTEDDLRSRPRGPDRWSIHEIVGHVTDSEIQGVFRLRKVISQDGCELPGYDQDAWVAHMRYREDVTAADRRQMLCLFAELRRLMLPVLRRATQQDWQKAGMHPEYGHMSLRTLLELYSDHAERHIEQVLESRRLIGRPIELPLLLPERLY